MMIEIFAQNAAASTIELTKKIHAFKEEVVQCDYQHWILSSGGVFEILQRALKYFPDDGSAVCFSGHVWVLLAV